MAGLLDPQNRDSLIQGLLGFGGGMLANNTGHYGQFGPAAGAGVTAFNQNYFGSVQQNKENAMRKQQLAMLEKMQGSQIAENDAQAKYRQYQMDMALQAQRDAEHDRGLGGFQPPVQTQGAIPQEIQVRPLPMQPSPEGQPLADHSKLFPTQTRFPLDLNGGPMPGQMPRPMQPQEQVMPQMEVNAAPSDAAAFLKEADMWKERAGKAKTKEYRDQYYNNYRSAFDKYADFVKQENTGEAWIPVEGVAGALRKKGTQEFQFNGQPATGAEIHKLALDGKRAGATNITTKNILSTEKHYGEKFAGKIAEQDSSMLETATKAPDLADRANSIKQVLASGKVITGTGADYRLALGKAMGLVGMGGDKETIANTESLTVDLARNTLDSIKASGLGAGNGFSNADRDFLEKAAGGKITLEASTIDRLATLAHRAAEKGAAKWNARVKMIPKSALAGTGIDRTPITVPSLFQGAGQSGQNRKSMIPKGYTVERIED